MLVFVSLFVYLNVCGFVCLMQITKFILLKYITLTGNEHCRSWKDRRAVNDVISIFSSNCLSYFVLFLVGLLIYLPVKYFVKYSALSYVFWGVVFCSWIIFFFLSMKKSSWDNRRLVKVRFFIPFSTCFALVCSAEQLLFPIFKGYALKSE